MSSFIGVVNGDKELISKVGSVGKHLSPIADSSLCTIFAEPESNRLSYSKNPSKGWISSGIGIHPHPNTSLVSSTDWEHLFTNDSNNLERLNGHFAAVKFNDHCVELFTDQIGMRSLFLIEVNNAIIFSTRIDWLLPFSNRTIDWKLFGENWLSVNAFSGNSFINGIHRIHSAAKCSIDKNGLSHTPKSWSPSPTEIDIEEYLFKLTSAVFKEANSLSLGLSGGLDSRLLLAILAGNSDLDYDLYTFSGLGHPDEELAKKLGELTHKTHRFHNYSLEAFDLDELGTQSTRSLLNSSIGGFLTNHLYKILGENDLVSIDGGIGEIGRRRYLKSIELKAKRALIANNTQTIAPFFFSEKADIFQDDFKKVMENGFHNGLKKLIRSMPRIPNKNIGNWLDLFSIRTRLLNIAGLNQENVDSTHYHIMPFVQPDFLNSVLSLPESERLNANWYRRLIKKHLNESTNLPLVKGDEIYPYWMNDISSQIWIRLQKRVKHSFTNPLLTNTLLQNQDKIRDICSSHSFIQSNFYNQRKVTHLIQSFYDDNNYHYASSLNWLLTFELFRKKLGNESI